MPISKNTMGKVVSFDEIIKKYDLDNPNRGGSQTGMMGGMGKKQTDALFYFWFIMCILFWFVSPLSGLFVTGFFIIINYKRLKRIFTERILRKKEWVKLINK